MKIPLCLLAFGLGALVAGCSSTGGLAPAGSASPQLTTEDLAVAIFALDLPDSAEPLREGPRVVYGATLNAQLVRADAEAIVGRLPPPAQGRSYAVYGFAPADQLLVRRLPAGGAANPLNVVPKICTTASAQKDRDTIAVHVILPRGGNMLVVPEMTLAALETRIGAPLPVCEGHSG